MMNDTWIDHERVLAGLPPRDPGECITGVTVQFCATHDDPAGIKPRHEHTWKVQVWFPEGRDGREILKHLQMLADQLDGIHIDAMWGEGIARAFGRRLQTCVAVDVWRDDEPFAARWTAK